MSRDFARQLGKACGYNGPGTVTRAGTYRMLNHKSGSHESWIFKRLGECPKKEFQSVNIAPEVPNRGPGTVPDDKNVAKFLGEIIPERKLAFRNVIGFDMK
jgi:hypothetical protein